MTIDVVWAAMQRLWLLTSRPRSPFPPRKQLLTAVVGGAVVVVVTNCPIV